MPDMSVATGFQDWRELAFALLVKNGAPTRAWIRTRSMRCAHSPIRFSRIAKKTFAISLCTRHSISPRSAQAIERLHDARRQFKRNPADTGTDHVITSRAHSSQSIHAAVTFAQSP